MTEESKPTGKDSPVIGFRAAPDLKAWLNELKAKGEDTTKLLNKLVGQERDRRLKLNLTDHEIETQEYIEMYKHVIEHSEQELSRNRKRYHESDSLDKSIAQRNIETFKRALDRAEKACELCGLPRYHEPETRNCECKHPRSYHYNPQNQFERNCQSSDCSCSEFRLEKQQAVNC